MQCLVSYPNDPNGMTYHHRILLKKLTPGRWVCGTPDMGIEIVDLNERHHYVLSRNGNYPPEAADSTYGFDAVTKPQLRDLHRRVDSQAAILGDGLVADEVGYDWYISETSHAQFGSVISEGDAGDMLLGTEKGVATVNGVEISSRK